MQTSSSQSVWLTLLFLLSTLSSCCWCRPACCRESATGEANAELSLILDVHQDSRAAFMALDERQQHEAIDQAWAQVQATLPAGVYQTLGRHSLAVGPDGWPTRAAKQSLARTVLISAGLDPNDPPRGCQYDQHPVGSDPRTIKCEWALRIIDVRWNNALPELKLDLGFSIHTRFTPTHR